MAMDFKKATDELLAPISHQELADALGVSIPSVRQARLDGAAKAHRKPPEGWERVIKRMAEKKAQHFQRLAEKLG
jgi:hypothetical protein